MPISYYREEANVHNPSQAATEMQDEALTLFLLTD
jgi:hypothetical protein